MTKFEQEKNILDVVAERLAQRWTTPGYINYELAAVLLEISELEQLCYSQSVLVHTLECEDPTWEDLLSVLKTVQMRLENIGRPLHRNDLVNRMRKTGRCGDVHESCTTGSDKIELDKIEREMMLDSLADAACRISEASRYNDTTD